MAKEITQETQKNFITAQIERWRTQFDGSENEFKAELPGILSRYLNVLTGRTITLERAREIISEDAPQFVTA